MLLLYKGDNEMDISLSAADSFHQKNVEGASPRYALRCPRANQY